MKQGWLCEASAAPEGGQRPRRWSTRTAYRCADGIVSLSSPGPVVDGIPVEEQLGASDARASLVVLILRNGEGWVVVPNQCDHQLTHTFLLEG